MRNTLVFMLLMYGCVGHVRSDVANPESDPDSIDVVDGDSDEVDGDVEQATDEVWVPSDDDSPADNDIEPEPTLGRRLAVVHKTSCLRRGATVWCWGSNEYGQIGDGNRDDGSHFVPILTDQTDVERFAVSRWASYAVRTDGSLWVSGVGSFSLLPWDVRVPTEMVGPGQVREAVGNYHASCIVTQARTVSCRGNDSHGEVGNGAATVGSGFNDTGLGSAVGLTGGWHHMCAISNGDVWCWGQNDLGQVGAGNGDIQTFPLKTVVPGVVIDVATGEHHTCAVNDEGDVYCWGSNWGGQAGAGSSDNCDGRACVRSPRKINLPFEAIQVTASSGTSCGLSSTGLVQCWGQSELKNGAASLTNVVEIASGHEAQHFCALVGGAQEQVYCWGNNGVGQLGSNTNGAARSSAVQVVFP